MKVFDFHANLPKQKQKFCPKLSFLHWEKKMARLHPPVGVTLNTKRLVPFLSHGNSWSSIETSKRCFEKCPLIYLGFTGHFRGLKKINQNESSALTFVDKCAVTLPSLGPKTTCMWMKGDFGLWITLWQEYFPAIFGRRVERQWHIKFLDSQQSLSFLEVGLSTIVS